MSVTGRKALLPTSVRRLVAKMLLGGVHPMRLVQLLGVSRGSVIHCLNRFGSTLLFRREEFRQRYEKMTTAQLRDALAKARQVVEAESPPTLRQFQMDGMPPVTVTRRTKRQVNYKRQDGTIGCVDRDTFDSLYTEVRKSDLREASA